MKIGKEIELTPRLPGLISASNPVFLFISIVLLTRDADEWITEHPKVNCMKNN